MKTNLEFAFVNYAYKIYKEVFQNTIYIAL